MQQAHLTSPCHVYHTPMPLRRVLPCTQYDSMNAAHASCKWITPASRGGDWSSGLQASVAALSEELQVASDPSQPSPQSAWPKMDDAIQALLAESHSRQLPGRLYGRLHSLATVPAAGNAVPVNAVLGELCNLVSPCFDSEPKSWQKMLLQLALQSESSHATS